MSTSRLAGKVAIITGAASGIGEATARLFASHGATVVIADIQDELGSSVAASIGSAEKSSYWRCDVRDEKQVEELVQYTADTYGRLDILFSNAGVLGPPTSILEMDMGDLDRTVAVNVRGAASAIKHAARAMVARQTRGSIICTASVAACMGGVGTPSYTASKHALVGLVRSASGELGKHGIRVNCISPHGVATPLSCGFLGWSPSAVEKTTSAMTNLKGVVLRPRQIAEAALFLASDDSSSFITGHNLVVDGGFTVSPGSVMEFLFNPPQV